MHSHKLRQRRELSSGELGPGDIQSLHVQLNELINGMQEVLDEALPRIRLVPYLDRYIELTLRHFATEEVLMFERAYPEYANHKLMHDCSVEYTYQVDRIALIESSEKAQELVDRLSDWLTNHIREDLDMTAFVFDKPNSVKS